MKLQNWAGGSKWRCLHHFVLSWNCLRTNRTGSPCARYYTQTAAPETTSCPSHPFPKSKTFQVHTRLNCIKKKNPPWKSTWHKCFQCLPKLGPAFLRLENSFPYEKKMSQCLTLWESHSRWSHSYSLMHIHPYIYSEMTPSEFRRGYKGQVQGRPRLCPNPASPPAPDRWNTHS